jgi:4-hydroxy-tetrahydrodipicolinate synthase
LSSEIYHAGHARSSVVKGVKCALNVLKICDDFMAEPFHPFRGKERAKIEQWLSEAFP